MNASQIRNALKAASVPFTEENGHSGFTYTQFVFKDLRVALQAEAASKQLAMKDRKRWVIRVY